jgi:hypothetical protein
MFELLRNGDIVHGLYFAHDVKYSTMYHFEIKLKPDTLLIWNYFLNICYENDKNKNTSPICEERMSSHS